MFKRTYESDQIITALGAHTSEPDLYVRLSHHTGFLWATYPVRLPSGDTIQYMPVQTSYGYRDQYVIESPDF